MIADMAHRATVENGPSVVAGKLLWTSATGITAADPNSYAGCTRRWYFDQVEDRKAPPTKAMLGGTDLHKEIENHLRTGKSLQSPLALAGRRFVPHPGSSLLIEKPIRFATRDGVNIFGHVDLYNLRGQYIDTEGVLQQDPPWSMEVRDWKTTSDFQYAKTERELGDNIQLVTYAEAGFREWPDLEHGRLTHVYFRTRGRPESRLVTIRRSRDEIGARWEYAESVVRIMGDAAKEQSADRVPANTKSCTAYSGCPHAGYCSAYRKTSLDGLYSKIATDWTDERKSPVGLLLNGNMTNPPAAAPQQSDTRAQLAQEEVRMRAQVAQQQQQMPTAPTPTASLAEVCTRLGSYGFGMPALGGNAAQAYAKMGGQSIPPGFVYGGLPAQVGAKRSLHGIQLTEVAHIFQLEGELAAERAAAAPPVQMPTNTPAFTQQVANAYNSILPPDAPESIPALAMQHTTMPAQIYTLGSEPAAAPPKASRGRPKKEKDVAPESAAVTPAAQIAAAPQPLTVASSPTASAATPVTPAATSPSPVALDTPRAVSTISGFGCVLVNARFEGRDTKSLAGYVDYVNGELAKRYNVSKDGKPGIQDVRCPVEGSVLGYGGWKGAVREVVKADPPAEALYHLDVFMDDLREAVADALRVVAEQKGWLYIRGVRS